MLIVAIDHIVNNIVYLLVIPGNFVAIFPNPFYKNPNDMFFEATGISRPPPVSAITVMTVRMIKDVRLMTI